MCAKLHNYVGSMKDEWTDVDDDIELESYDSPLGASMPISRVGTAAAGTALLQKIMVGALRFNRQPGGLLVPTGPIGNSHLRESFFVL